MAEYLKYFKPFKNNNNSTTGNSTTTYERQSDDDNGSRNTSSPASNGHFKLLSSREVYGKVPHFVESTPYYIASREACSRIAAVLPSVKLVILLRDPVQRAYSEYQMKTHRVRLQQEFFILVDQFSVEIYSCLQRLHRTAYHTFQRPDFNVRDDDHPNNSIEMAIKHCFPMPIQVHPQFSNLLKAFVKTLTNSNSNVQLMLNQCFKTTADIDSTNRLKDITDADPLIIPWQQRSYSRAKPFNNSSHSITFNNDLREPHTQPRGNRTLHCYDSLQPRLFQTFDGFVDVNDRKYGNVSLLRPTLDPLHCFQHTRKDLEQVRSIEEVFFKEVRDYQQCAQVFLNASELSHDVPIGIFFKI